MTDTNPGTWPDDWHGDVDDGKRKEFAELDKTIPLYTAAEMKAARLETVERCIAAVKREERADVEYLAQPANVVYNTAIEHCMRALYELKEEIENEG